MIDVVCLKWGDAYGPEYANRLKNAVARHLSYDHQFYCITDDASGLDPDIAVIPMDDKMYPKWWGKLLAFSGEFKNRVIVFDLDTVIVDSIDFLAAHNGFAALQGFGYPFRLGSAVMTIPPGFGREIVDWYEKDPKFAQMFCGQWGDGHWMQLNVGPFDRLQETYPDKFVSFKWHCCERLANGQVDVAGASIPEGAAVICFHGTPRPHEVEPLPWMRKHWTGEHDGQGSDEDQGGVEPEEGSGSVAGGGSEGARAVA